MKRANYIIHVLLLSIAIIVSTDSMAADLYIFENHKVCVDDDGIVVITKGQGSDNYGVGYSLEQVKEDYGLNFKDKESTTVEECPID